MNHLKYFFNYIESCNMCGSMSKQILGLRMNRSQGKSPAGKTGVAVTVVRCKRCGLIYSDPQPVPMDIQDHYGSSPEDYRSDWNENYFHAAKQYHNTQLQELKKIMPVYPGMRFLDIGASVGASIKFFQEAGFDAYGMEPGKLFYQRAIQYAKISPDKIKCCTMETANYPDGHFDFIFFGTVLEHLYDPSAAIIQAIRWLKPGGIIHIEVPHSKWLVSKIINAYYKIRGTNFVTNLSPMHAPFHLYEFSAKSFYVHARTNGYKVVKHDHWICTTHLPKILDVILKPLMKITGTGLELSVWLKRIE